MSGIPNIPGVRPLPQTSNPVVDEWIAKAAGDLETAGREAVVANSPNYDAVCFHAQQAVEKLLKAVLIGRGITPKFTHDLVVLSGQVELIAPVWKGNHKDLRLLTLAAVQYRYPGFGATRQDAIDALSIMADCWTSLITLL